MLRGRVGAAMIKGATKHRATGSFDRRKLGNLLIGSREPAGKTMRSPSDARPRPAGVCYLYRSADIPLHSVVDAGVIKD